MEVDRGDDDITRLGFENAKTVKTPKDQGFLKDISDSAPMEDDMFYRSVDGALRYLTTCKRPDIATSASILGCQFSNSNFLKETKDWKRRLGDGKCWKPNVTPIDWAGDIRIRKSMTGYSGGAVSVGKQVHHTPCSGDV